MRRSLAIPLLTICWLPITAGLAAAQQQLAASENSSAAPEDEGAGKLVPARNRFRGQLEERGVAFGFGYVAETLPVVEGGVRGARGVDYLGSLTGTVSLNLSQLHVGRGEVFMSGQWLHGRSVNNERVGAAQAFSNLDNDRFGKFIEAWYADTYLNGLIRVKAGRQYADADFGAVENGADFLNSSYGLNPTTPMPTYPSPELGASVWLAPTSWISCGAGLFKGGTLDPLEEEGSPVQRNPFTILEARLEPFSKASASHGSYRVGFWRQSRAIRRTGADEQSRLARNHGLYMTADHWFMRTPSGEHRGPGLFFQYGWTPSDRNQLTGYTGGGVAWAGLLPSRPGDTVGIGLTRAQLNGRARETIYELFYKCWISNKLMVQPDLQWAVHPMATERNALVAGVRLGVEF